MFRKLTILAATMLLTVAVGAAFADHDEGRALTALIRGTANLAPTEDPCILINTPTATGLALNIGKFTWETQEVVDFGSSPDCLSPDSAEIDGQFVITAANLDQIFGVFQSVAQIDSVTNEITGLGHYEITGGTGRFEDAKGKGVSTVVGSLLPPFEFTGQLIARLSSDHD